MAKFTLYVEQRHQAEGSIRGFFNQEASELVTTTCDDKGWFTIVEIGDILQHASYEGCELMKAEIVKVDLDEEAVFLEAGAMCIGDENRQRLAAETLEEHLRVPKAEITKIFDENGRMAFLDWVNEQVRLYR